MDIVRNDIRNEYKSNSLSVLHGFYGLFYQVKKLQRNIIKYLNKLICSRNLLGGTDTFVDSVGCVQQQIQPIRRFHIPRHITAKAYISLCIVILCIYLLTTETPLPEKGFKDAPANMIETKAELRETAQQEKIENTFEIKPYLKEYSSKQALVEWLKQDNTDKLIYVPVSFSDEFVDTGNFDCDDFAKTLQVRAGTDGYLMSTVLTGEDDQMHMINSVIIGNALYYIEPQTDEVWLYCYLD